MAVQEVQKFLRFVSGHSETAAPMLMAKNYNPVLLSCFSPASSSCPASDLVAFLLSSACIQWVKKADVRVNPIFFRRHRLRPRLILTSLVLFLVFSCISKCLCVRVCARVNGKKNEEVGGFHSSHEQYQQLHHR